MRVLVIAPPYVENFLRNARWDSVGISGSFWPPIYLAYCAGLLESRGHTVKLSDAQVEGLTHEQTYQLAKDFKPDLTLLTFTILSMKNDLTVANKIKELTGSEVCLVGHAGSFEPQKTLEQSGQVKYVARGEFDFTALDLANGVSPKDIKGLIWKDDTGAIHTNPPRELPTGEQLDTFPFVTQVYKKHLNIRNYRQAAHLYPFIDLFTGRGCSWGRCSFCLWPNTLHQGGYYHRQRNIESVIEELKYIQREIPEVKEVYIQDDVLDSERATELSEAILRHNLKLTWSCYSRADKKYETLKLMKRAGCYIMETGFESINDKGLKMMKKGVHTAQAERYCYDAARVGINVIGAFMVGMPGDTRESIIATTYWARRMPILRYTVTMARPYPGTPLWDELHQNGWVKDGKPNYPHLSSEEIYDLTKWSLKTIYMSPHYFARTLKHPRQWTSIAISAKAFFTHLYAGQENRGKSVEW